MAWPSKGYQWPCTFYNKAPYIKFLLKISFSVKLIKVSTNCFIFPVINCILKDTHQKPPKQPKNSLIKGRSKTRDDCYWMHLVEKIERKKNPTFNLRTSTAKRIRLNYA